MQDGAVGVSLVMTSTRRVVSEVNMGRSFSARAGRLKDGLKRWLSVAFPGIAAQVLRDL